MKFHRFILLCVLNFWAPGLIAAPTCRQIMRIEGENLLVGVLRSHLTACQSVAGKTELEVRRLPHPPRRFALENAQFDRYSTTIESARKELEQWTDQKPVVCLHPVRVVFPRGSKEQTFEACKGHPNLWIAQSLDDMIFVLATAKRGEKPKY